MVNYGPASKYYDLFGSKNDIAFYRELAIRHGRKALELGVGTGRVAIELAKAGVAVWGIDNSKYMLAVARQKLRRGSPVVRKQVKLKLGDMRSFKLEETFPFVYIASSTFEHCVTREDQLKCLASVYKALESGGILAFDISQPSEEKASCWHIDRRQLDKECEVVRMIFSRLNPQTSVVSVNLFFDVYRKGVLEERYYECGEAKLSSKKEVVETLKTTGFIVKRIYGDFDKSAYSKQSQRIVFVSSRP
jgi:ubiquinone/menaquinone biosynthesis C-methylase UbiE